jgi:integrase
MTAAIAAVVAAALPGLPAAAAERLRDFAAAAAKGGLAAKTIAAMRSDGRLFAAWCADRGEPWLPASPRTVAAFVEAMAARKAPATIQRYLASIALWHAAAELANPTTHLLVKMARKAHLRAVGARQKQAAPLGDTEIGALAAALDEAAGDPDPLVRLAALRDRALLLVANDTLARAAELVDLRWEDLAIDDEGDGRILVRRSKTDQDGQGRQRWLDRTTVQALLAWRQAHDAALERKRAGEAARLAALHAKRFPRSRWPQGRRRLNPVAVPVALEWEASPYLFRGLTPQYGGANGRARGWSLRMSTATVSRIIKRRLQEIGRDPTGYSAHSTRVGKLQDLLAEGVDLLGAMDAGGWKSPAMPARYGENILAARGAVASQRKKRRTVSAPDDDPRDG